MFVNVTRHKIAISALAERGEYVIEYSDGKATRYFAVGPRNSVPELVRRLCAEIEAALAPQDSERRE